MATFESDTCTEPLEYKKYPLRRMELAIQKFLKVIQIDLARLHRHKLNIGKFSRVHDWNNLHTEQLNATRTIQQVKANIREIEKSRNQVQDDDLSVFDEKIYDMKNNATRAVQEFIELYSGTKTAGSSTDSSPEIEVPVHSIPCFPHTNSTVHTTAHSHTTIHSLPLDGSVQIQELRMEPQKHSQVIDSWEHLQENLEELNALIHQFSSTVHIQQEAIDHIEDNIEHAQDEVHQGAKHLGKGLMRKAVVFPVTGALMGAALGGPIGLIAGMKIGGVIGAVGGAAGYFGGNVLQKRQEKATEIELSKLSRANSLPEITTDTQSNNSWFSWGGRRNQSTAEMENT